MSNRTHELMHIYGAVDEKILKEDNIDEDRRAAVDAHLKAAANHTIEQMAGPHDVEEQLRLMCDFLCEYYHNALTQYMLWKNSKDEADE
jgi:hypothetical protein